MDHLLRALRALLWAGGVTLALLLIGLFVFASSIETTEHEPEPADGMVVMTGTSVRIVAAMRLLSERKAKRLLISGVFPAVTAATIKSLTDEGKALVNCCVDLDRRALNTVGNAEETRDWADKHGFRSLIVVTSSYHMPRTMAELERVMAEFRLIPYGVIEDNFEIDRWWLNPRAARLVVSEYGKYLPALARLGASRLVQRGGSQLDRPAGDREAPAKL